MCGQHLELGEKKTKNVTDGTLVFAWLGQEAIHIWDTKKGEPLHLVDIDYIRSSGLIYQGMGPEFSAWLITSSKHGLHKQGKLQVKWRWRMTSIWISSVWVVQESGFVLTINQPRGGILGSQALPLSHYPTHPQTVPTCILFEIRLLVHGRSRIQSQEKRFFSFLGDMQCLLLYSWMVGTLLLVMHLERY